MKYSLVHYPDERLRKPTVPVVNFDAKLRELLEDMEATMKEHKGIGIAAPQVGASLRCFLVHLDNEVITYVNPEILKVSEEEEEYEEGCLSVPGVYAKVVRPVALIIKANDENGKEFEMEVDEIYARVIQHELDHLDGVLFFDHLRSGNRKRLLKIYKQLQEERKTEDEE